jgi:serine phosphatase RsbU (regulator of sigma subunit)
MASTSQTPWYLRKPKRSMHFQSVPLSRLRVFLVAAFLLFSTWGAFGDLINYGHDPYLVLASNMVFSGAIAIVWVLVFARLPLFFIALPLLLQIGGPYVMNRWIRVLMREFDLRNVDSATGIRVCAIAMMVAVVSSYVFFIMFIRGEGKESFKLRNELELAHGIQQTLVPPFTLHTGRFEIYGISKPSEKVGGDLVDALELGNGDAIAYLGDIAGHGLQAGILMGMLKTAVRTALLDAGECEANQTLPVLLDRLNRVLPTVKEQHMYATFSAFRLGADGAAHYALAASPPILHWHANRSAMSKVEEEQFPLGLLPVSEFDGERLPMERGDLVVVATDGILEVCDKRQEEFGIERVKLVIGANSGDALPELATKILESARLYGKQIDDQTILLIRCL